MINKVYVKSYQLFPQRRAHVASQTKLADQDLPGLSTVVRLAAQMGEGVGAGEVLLCEVPAAATEMNVAAS